MLGCLCFLLFLNSLPLKFEKLSLPQEDDGLEIRPTKQRSWASPGGGKAWSNSIVLTNSNHHIHEDQ